MLPAFAPEFEPKLFEPLNELVCDPAPPNGDVLNDPLFENAWLPPNPFVPDPDEDDVTEFPPFPIFWDDDWLDDEVPLIPFGPSNTCVSDPLFANEILPSFPWNAV